MKRLLKEKVHLFLTRHLFLMIFLHSGFEQIFDLAWAAEELQSAPKASSSLVIAMSQEFDTLNPVLSTMSSSASVYAFAGRGLVFLDTNGNWQAALVDEIPSFEKGTAWRVEQNGITRTHSRWKIRSQARWGDGRPVTAADVIFSWNVGLNPKVPVAARTSYTGIESILPSKENPLEFTVIHSGTVWDFYKVDGLFILPLHLEGKLYEAHKNETEGYERNTLYNTEVKNPGLYNGPYVVSDLKIGSHVELKVNPYFYGPSPQISRILVRVIPSTITLESYLFAGNIDMVHAIGLGFDQAIGLEKIFAQKKLPYKVVYFPGPVYEHIVFNLDDQFLSDRRVRQALAFGFDRQSLVKNLFGGKVQVASHFISENDPWFSIAGVSAYPYSPRRARALLQEAGFAASKTKHDGILEKDGLPLRLILNSTAGNATRERTEALIQEQWRQIGVDVVISNTPAKVFFGEVVAKKKFQHLAMFAEEFEYESSPKGLFDSKNIPSAENGYAGTNYSAWQNKVVDSLLASLEREDDAQKRKMIAQSLAVLYSQELPHLPLYFRVTPQVVPADLLNQKGYTYFSGLQAEYWRRGNASLSQKATLTEAH